MNRKIIFLVLCLLSGYIAMAQQAEVSPVPQNMQLKSGHLSLGGEVQVLGREEADSHAVAKLDALLPLGDGKNGKVDIYIGERGDKAVRKYAQKIPKEAEGYYLSVDENKIVLAGNDERGTFYAVQTLAQLLDKGVLPFVEITDYPVVRFRGVVEGFYGTPWSHEARMSQLEFYGRHKMNTYIYGPKDDPYHRTPHWREPYPEEEARQIAELARQAKENAVDFVWAIHPGQDIKWNDADRDLLLAKFEKMYRLGVRSFAVFFDDISGEGTNPEKQAALLNYIDERFIQAKGDVTPLIMCPTIYNKAWNGQLPDYLPTLGERLNPSIQIMWTGNSVISDITLEGVEWVNPLIKRKAYIWWNYPVTDYIRDRLLMGRVYGLEKEAGSQISGFTSNPMEHPEASKIAIASIADFAWNPQAFDSEASWKRAVRDVLPGDADALQVFASHNADLGENGHGYRREESVEIQPVAQRYLNACRTAGTGTREDALLLRRAYADMVEAADRLLVNEENPALIRELKPWLLQFRVVGVSGMAAIDLMEAAEKGDALLFEKKYKHLRALQKQRYLINQQYNQNPYHPGAVSASLVMQPLADSLFVLATFRHNQATGDTLPAVLYTSPHKAYSNIPQCANLPVRVKGNRVYLSPVLEVVHWLPEQYLGIALEKNASLGTVAMDFGMPGAEAWLKLEVSADGKDWQPLVLSADGAKGKLKADAAGVTARYVRLTNTGDDNRDVRLKAFSVYLNKQE